MTWDEIEAATRQKIRAQPRGYATRLAEKLGVSRAAVSHMVRGEQAIPSERIADILDTLGLELCIAPKGTNDRLRAVFQDPDPT
ncbi:helix-turn-helix domain-containing protein [Deinococcus yavapaiensis]|uniref:Helix-turn-helix protein n=1 Tax=Deinococcus yavapaiensis KR-236 TaxID=694435 RepID=A0A318S649_9DEIO|nr:helix-turn-helix transcriptional regulator [Deinococcus yavapaiensis]PYE53180.1 helix-turn-helix protein [Deinococcus yavapaiensis KR-236]